MNLQTPASKPVLKRKALLTGQLKELALYAETFLEITAIRAFPLSMETSKREEKHDSFRIPWWARKDLIPLYRILLLIPTKVPEQCTIGVEILWVERDELESSKKAHVPWFFLPWSGVLAPCFIRRKRAT